MAEPEAFDQFVINVSRQTWEVFRRDALLFVVASVVMIVVSTVSLGLIAGPVTVGYIEMVRRSQRGEPLALSLLFSRFDTFVPCLVALVIGGIGVTIGMFLLVVPGLLLALFLTWTLHVIAFEQTSGIEAMKRSLTLVQSNFVQTIALVLLISIAHAIGGAIFFGILLTGPLALIALTLGYERLVGIAPAQDSLRSDGASTSPGTISSGPFQ